jgi:outer membrane immunogenic protein
MNRLICVAAGIAASTVLATGAMAADAFTAYNPPAYDNFSAGAFNFEGLYAGVYGGAFSAGSLYGAVGLVAGVNFALVESVYVGGEFQVGWIGGGGGSTWDALGLARVGAAVTDSVMVYGDLGVGLLDSDAVWAVGGGIELAVTEAISVRGDIQGIGAWGGGFEAVKATAGLLFQLD